MLDGETTGPNTFKGPLGQLISGELTHLDLEEFIPISSDQLPSLSQEEVKALSTDQKYLYKITKAINNGTVPKELAAMKPGNLSHSRWVTFANRICRLYVSTSHPSEELTTITEFVMKAYAPGWFSIFQCGQSNVLVPTPRSNTNH